MMIIITSKLQILPRVFTELLYTYVLCIYNILELYLYLFQLAFALTLIFGYKESGMVEVIY